MSFFLTTTTNPNESSNKHHNQQYRNNEDWDPEEVDDAFDDSTRYQHRPKTPDHLQRSNHKKDYFYATTEDTGSDYYFDETAYLIKNKYNLPHNYYNIYDDNGYHNDKNKHNNKSKNKSKTKNKHKYKNNFQNHKYSNNNNRNNNNNNNLDHHYYDDHDLTNKRNNNQHNQHYNITVTTNGYAKNSSMESKDDRYDNNNNNKNNRMMTNNKTQNENQTLSTKNGTMTAKLYHNLRAMSEPAHSHESDSEGESNDNDTEEKHNEFTMLENSIPIIVDNGSFRLKAGFMNDCDYSMNNDSQYVNISNSSLNSSQSILSSNHNRKVRRNGAGPDIVIPSMIGRKINYGRKKRRKRSSKKLKIPLIGDEAQEKREACDLNFPIVNGVIDNWDDVQTLWSYLFFTKLDINCEDHPILMTESPFNTKDKRANMAEILYETFNFPKLAVAMDAILELYHTGQTTGVSVSSGYNLTNIIPIYEGIPIESAFNTLNIAGISYDSIFIFVYAKKKKKAKKKKQIKIMKKANRKTNCSGSCRKQMWHSKKNADQSKM